MDPTAPYPGGRTVLVEGLLGRLLKRPSVSKPAGDDRSQQMRVSALQTEGLPIGFTTYRPSDISGRRPLWYGEFAVNVGDIDNAPIGIPMGPRHFGIVPRGR